jgi:hypothetical protein
MDAWDANQISKADSHSDGFQKATVGKGLPRDSFASDLMRSGYNPSDGDKSAIPGQQVWAFRT